MLQAVSSIDRVLRCFSPPYQGHTQTYRHRDVLTWGVALIIHQVKANLAVETKPSPVHVDDAFT